MKQQCYLAAIYLNWAVFLGGAGFLLFKRHYAFALLWLLLAPLGAWLYIRIFPSISQALGYGRIDDRPTPDLHDVCDGDEQPASQVTLYTALGCPFCPIVKRRLQGLQERFKFQLREVDVTLQPGILAEKGIRAVPVVEAEDRRIEGNATSEQLAELLSRHAARRLRSLSSAS
jgi:glutaredoxin